MAIFEDDPDYAAFESILADAVREAPLRLYSYCLMPNHWHLVLEPDSDGDLARFMHRITTTHVRRWHKHRQTTGIGHLYQGPFKSFPIQRGAHFFKVCRYVERNALRAKLVTRAEAWPWCSLWRWLNRQNGDGVPVLEDWPDSRPKGWVATVNQAETSDELESVRRCVTRGQPYGDKDWVLSTSFTMNLGSALRPRGRPKKGSSTFIFP